MREDIRFTVGATEYLNPRVYGIPVTERAQVMPVVREAVDMVYRALRPHAIYTTVTLFSRMPWLYRYNYEHFRAASRGCTICAESLDTNPGRCPESGAEVWRFFRNRTSVTMEPWEEGPPPGEVRDLMRPFRKVDALMVMRNARDLVRSSDDPGETVAWLIYLAAAHLLGEQDKVDIAAWRIEGLLK